MSFVTWAALAIGAFVVVPLLAHMLRRRPPVERKFAAVEFVPQHAADAQQRAAIEDRALLAVRIAAVCLLALLGATPLIRCDNLSLARPTGASVAVVVVLDDSASMRARPGSSSLPGKGVSRFSEAKRAAEELLNSLRGGDVVAVVLAGRPARVALAPSRDFSTALRVLAEHRQSDRATDLDGALHLAGDLLRDLPQVDKRVVLLSDRADASGTSALRVRAPAKLWVPLPEMGGDVTDCAVLRADRVRAKVEVQIACHVAEESDDSLGKPRHLQLRDGDRVLVQVPVSVKKGVVNWSLALPSAVKQGEVESDRWQVVLTGGDAVSANDFVPVTEARERPRVGVVSDSSRASVVTGGAPPVEKALRSLGITVQPQPLASVPDRRADFDGLRALIADDVAGLTPPQRRELASWLDRGGVLVLTLGPGAASAPLGAGFSPVIDGVVRWSRHAPEGLALDDEGLFGQAAPGLLSMAAKGRTQLALEKPADYTVLSRWKDGKPFMWRKRHGRGVAYLIGLPLSTDTSDLALRPAFLVLLQAVVEQARSRGGVGKTLVGSPWVFPGYRDVHIDFKDPSGEQQELKATLVNGRPTFMAPRVGRYRLMLDGEESLRTVTFDSSEVDMRPRPFEESASASELGGNDSRVDVSAYIALALLLLIVLEFGLRLRGARLGWRRREATPS